MALYVSKMTHERKKYSLSKTVAVSGIVRRKMQNATTLHADLLLASITQLITVVVADRIHKPEYFRSLKRLIA